MSEWGIWALVAHARDVPATRRAGLAAELRRVAPPGSLVIVTCHRVELYAAGTEPVSIGAGRTELRSLLDIAAARHFLEMAAGLDSAVLAEDEVLGQLRQSVRAARSGAPLAAPLDRLADIALRTGRRARSWLPTPRPTLAGAALDLALGVDGDPGGVVLVVGAGTMGGAAASAVLQRGGHVLLASRDPARGALVARRLGAEHIDDVSEVALTERLVAGLVVAFGGPWRPGASVERRLAAGLDWAIDLSAPPALSASLRRNLGPRLVTIDALATRPGDGSEKGTDALRLRLRRLVDEELAGFIGWLAASPGRDAARLLAGRAIDASQQELDALWQRVPSLDQLERAAVERMARQLVGRILREPLEELARDRGGHREQAARELFRL